MVRPMDNLEPIAFIGDTLAAAQDDEPSLLDLLDALSTCQLEELTAAADAILQDRDATGVR